MRATADICILADDDMRFVDGYEERQKAFALIKQQMLSLI